MTKKNEKDTINDEHSELDSAMNELVRQTDALLGQVKPKSQPKPKMPQKKIIPHKKGASLDIVGHAPSSLRRTNSEEKLISDKKKELITAHAGYSYNEESSEPAENNLPTQISRLAPSIIKPHEKNSALIINDGSPAKIKETNSEDADDHARKSSVKVEEKEDVGKVAVHFTAGKVINSTKKNQEKPNHNEVKETVATGDNDLVIPDEAVEDADDGIVKLDEAAEEKPTIYDTVEYQTELHDWSKLAKNSHWPVIVLIILIGLAIGLMYLYFTNNLPQIV
jgi:hypothetical protein